MSCTPNALKVVGDVLEIKGQGILLLGNPGKSTTSVMACLKYSDTSLVADDYCWIYIMDAERKYNRQIELLATAHPREETGVIRNNLNMLLYSEEEDLANKYFGIGTTDPMDKLRRRTHYIDTIAQRVAHKEWTKIDYIIIYTWTRFADLYVIMRYIRDKFPNIEEEKANKMIQYLNNVFNWFDPDEPDLFKKWKSKTNSYYLETDPKKRRGLIDFCRMKEDRGSNWAQAIKDSNVPFYIFYYYDNIMDKLRDVYTLISPIKPIYDSHQEVLEQAKREGYYSEYF
jgi:hypothetical protein